MPEQKALAPTSKILFAITALLVLVASVWSTQSSSARVDSVSDERVTGSLGFPKDSPASTAPRSKPGTLPVPGSDTKKTLSHKVLPGDTLSSIFSSLDAPMSDLHKIMEADVEYLALETLQPGTELQLTFDENNHFIELALELDAARTFFFTKTEDATFEYRKTKAEVHWVSEVLRGTIEGSFYSSALRAGLTKKQIASVGQLLEHKLDFRRDLRAGDQFAVIIGHEMVDDKSTGKSRLEAASLQRGADTHTAFRFDDGNYYDDNGRSVLPAFRRLPMTTSYRVSSHFSRNRTHPVTGRGAPHNGVDLATPTGTPILSTGDGIVHRIGNHPYAGKYIDIDHGNAYKTRYLHLHKILVKKGEKVQRGHKIALSGNTGRSTGPHLHFELHINGQPVNPLTAEIPTAADVPKAVVKRFEEETTLKLAVMSTAASRSNLMLAGTRASFD
ncbi:MAG: peptidoglycan DD-metalloendopeptidase family protein [Marinobacter sp.]